MPIDLRYHYLVPRVVRVLNTKCHITAKTRALVAAAKFDEYWSRLLMLNDFRAWFGGFGIGFARDRLGFWVKILTCLCQFFPTGEGTKSSLKSLLWNLAIKHRDRDVLRIENLDRLLNSPSWMC